MKYLIEVVREDGGFVITFRDAPGCVTECDSADEIVSVAREALEGWLETHLATGKVPPRPVSAIPAKALGIDVAPELALKLELLWARREAGLTQSQLAKKIGVSQQRIAALEDPDTEVKLSTAELVLRVLGRSLSLSSSPLAKSPKSKTAA